MQEMFDTEQERLESALMAQAYAYAGQRLVDVLPTTQRPSPEAATCAGCQGTFPAGALFTRSRHGALCNKCEDGRLAGVMG